MDLIRMNVADLVPYENNPRINGEAVPEVIKSIKQCGYITPIIIDEDNVVLAGHTRRLALIEMGVQAVDCIVMTGLDEEQKRKFRLLDNRTGEIADWDQELLLEELKGVDLGDITWFDDILNPNITELSGSEKETDTKTKEQKDEEIICPRCGAVVDGMSDEDEYPDWDESDEDAGWS